MADILGIISLVVLSISVTWVLCREQWEMDKLSMELDHLTDKTRLVLQHKDEEIKRLNEILEMIVCGNRDDDDNEET